MVDSGRIVRLLEEQNPVLNQPTDLEERVEAGK